MKHLLATSIVILLLAFIPAASMASGPSVQKSVLAGENGASVILITVSAGNTAIYGVTIEDQSASIEDIVAPKGWSSVASDEKAVFRTGNSPIQSGGSVSFRIVTTNENGALTLIFKDAKTQIGGKKTI
ncbi:MAG: hypothetical protein HY770_00035 [Chitinivibrionia bacterium]|nr:hypothetical protein [Chitinivibrionia bacterium]